MDENGGDYREKLRNDLIQQFRGKPHIDALNEVIGTQLNDLRRFFTALQTERGVNTAVGHQLDGVGDIVVLTRMEAGELACFREAVHVLGDETYRTYLLYKIWKNTNHCTYRDVLKAFRMFWDKPLYYQEDPKKPATMIFDAGILSPEDDAARLLSAPIVKAAGVGIELTATTLSPEVHGEIKINGAVFGGILSTRLPELVEGCRFDCPLDVAPFLWSVTETVLPELTVAAYVGSHRKEETH